MTTRYHCCKELDSDGLQMTLTCHPECKNRAAPTVPDEPVVSYAVDSYNGAGWVGIWKEHDTAWLVAGKATVRSGKRDIVVPLVPKADYDDIRAKLAAANARYVHEAETSQIEFERAEKAEAERDALKEEVEYYKAITTGAEQTRITALLKDKP